MSDPDANNGSSARLTVGVLQSMIKDLGAHRPERYTENRAYNKDTLIACIIWKKSDVYPICILKAPGYVPDPSEVITFPKPSSVPRPAAMTKPNGEYVWATWHRMDDSHISNDIYQRLSGIRRLKGGLDARWNSDQLQLAAFSSDDGLLFRLTKVSHKDALVAIAQYLDFSYVPASADSYRQPSNPLNNENHSHWKTAEFKKFLRLLHIDPDRTTRFEQYRLLLVRNILKIIDKYESQNPRVRNLFPQKLTQSQLAVEDDDVDEDTAMGGFTTTGRDLKQFHLFPKLAPEMRLAIFEMAMDDIGPRAVQPYVVRGVVKVTRRAPALFHVNREARSLCVGPLRSEYELFHAAGNLHGYQPGRPNEGFWFNPDKDTLYIGRRSLALCAPSLTTQTIKSQMPRLMAAAKSIAFYVRAYRGPILNEVTMFTNALHFIAVDNDEWLTFEPHSTNLHTFMTITVDLSQNDSQGKRGVVTQTATFIDASHSQPADWHLFGNRIQSLKDAWINGEAARVAKWNSDHQDPADHITARTGIIKFSLARAVGCEKEYHIPKTSKFHPLYHPDAPGAYEFEEKEAVSLTHQDDHDEGGMIYGDKLFKEREEISRLRGELDNAIEDLNQQRERLVQDRAEVERQRRESWKTAAWLQEKIGRYHGARILCEQSLGRLSQDMKKAGIEMKLIESFVKYKISNGKEDEVAKWRDELSQWGLLDKGTKGGAENIGTENRGAEETQVMDLEDAEDDVEDEDMNDDVENDDVENDDTQDNDTQDDDAEDDDAEDDNAEDDDVEILR
ncbi:hypothetical protein HYALB_00007564 [Hymenoscyphus albidus]|uniref:2EXR domain-containing protein n=1 Tax=Hymenoscyphus albidus TaxID=595503 RepID=A0A9N9Q623_9HELO|nr:hypothetical protein HYALB_00007564 [Hymenoscyphus albidus]